ncbi:protein-histidine N-methyltransferase [Malassezia psittaci]|uniref:Protein-histidine N-methyltransferase n=1 Tax=Malassezia psittaci TaxID=1821823 RepID=A0AAF0JD35_9BASI|nr:protein-histidine N-methyltransferase [Malassezia psittaci]
MAFAFKFEDSEEDEVKVSSSDLPSLNTALEIPGTEIRKLLPDKLSYSPLSTVHGTEHAELARRDLFDVRFQLLNEDKDSIDTSTDLLPGVYEGEFPELNKGGLKTWECALDLVSELKDRVSSYRQIDPTWPSSRHIAEIGCGTAVPTCYLLRKLLTADSSGPTVIDLCDYNEQVLALVVYPNLLLAWYFSTGPGKNQSIDASELEIEDSLLAEFDKSLIAKQIHLRFFSGGWDTLSITDEVGRAEIILSSETVYSIPRLPSLCSVLQQSSWPTSSQQTDAGLAPQTTICLVAAKVLYFGVGGGVQAFEEVLTRYGGWSKSCSEFTAGVGRVMLSVGFHP